jgi:hypothetical protein
MKARYKMHSVSVRGYRTDYRFSYRGQFVRPLNAMRRISASHKMQEFAKDFCKRNVNEMQNSSANENEFGLMQEVKTVMSCRNCGRRIAGHF